MEYLLRSITLAILAVTLGQCSEKSLIRHVLEQYEQDGRAGRPVRNASEPVYVDIAVSLIQIIEFDQLNQDLTVAGWITYQWDDEFLGWTEGDYPDSPDYLSMRPEDIWTPDIAVINTLAEPVDIHKARLIVSREGHVTWTTQKRLTLTCATNTEDDEPNCDLKFHSWTYDQDQMSLTASKGRIDAGFYVPHYEWELSKTKALLSKASYPCCGTKQFADLNFSFSLKRRPQEEEEDDADAGSQALVGSLTTLLFALCFSSL